MANTASTSGATPKAAKMTFDSNRNKFCFGKQILTKYDKEQVKNIVDICKKFIDITEVHILQKELNFFRAFWFLLGQNFWIQ